MNDKLKVGVVGCGIGRDHIRAYQGLPDQVEVVAVCNIVEASARQLAETLSFEATLQSDTNHHPSSGSVISPT